MQTRAAKHLLKQTNESIGQVVSRLRAASLTTQTYPPVSKKHAAVLVPLFENPSDGVVHVLLTRRTSTLSTHAGEVALPGGKRDETDVDDVHTALREAQEELGIDEVDVLGKLPPFLSKHFLSVTPVIGRIASINGLKPNPAEIDAIFDVPLHIFLDSNPDVYSFRDMQKSFGEDVSYRLHFFKHGPHTIWGLTAAICISAAALALGRDPDFKVMPGDRMYTDIVYDGEKIVFRDSNM